MMHVKPQDIILCAAGQYSAIEHYIAHLYEVFRGMQHQLQRMAKGLVPAGTGTKETHPTRGWDSFWSGPAPPSSA